MVEDPVMLKVIKQLDLSSDLDSKLILTTTGSIFKKMVERKESFSEDELSKLQSFNEDILISIIN